MRTSGDVVAPLALMVMAVFPAGVHVWLEVVSADVARLTRR
jgi:hypothetical protein